MIHQDTIAAIATPQGEGGILIIRVSGSGAKRVFQRCFQRANKGEIQSHRLYFGHVTDEQNAHLDEAMGVFMSAPNSYTREDVCELHCHGGRLLAQRVLSRVLKEDCRLAQPGEFTRRAFLNGRIDLSEAEAVMDLIGAGSEQAARSALNQLEGGVSHFVMGLKDRLTDLLSLIEAGNDFPEEIEEQDIKEQVREQTIEIAALLRQASDEDAARIVRDGISVALVGTPNVGKSSLLNALLKQDRAIVTPLPGTTRDVLTERLHVNGMLIELSDTAGQRDAGDEVEQIGIDRARKTQHNADLVLLVLDSSRPLEDEDRQLLKQVDDRTLIVLNKTDIQQGAGIDQTQFPSGIQTASVCALTGEGIDSLLHRICDMFAPQESVERQMTVQRHITCARDAAAALDRVVLSIDQGDPVDLCAIDLMQALSTLSEITGESATESVIDRIFARFCVGK
ncbi:tRNA uridine-5-carboxymethylaminomethyl(34) synthesis GTPase MnmE [Eubacteriales bacterium OttesenSCG-928-N13]|nr:tRNA uridine-5-carboxymethylaminomethyl(34) synthesis GTPase MnmE [Eubacteriales bacterium OttesenSCG-928-N13]